jgi:hypothetical protein
VTYDTKLAQGRAAAFAEIVADLDNRIKIISESISSGRHKSEHVICLQVTRRALAVARNDYSNRV